MKGFIISMLLCVSFISNAQDKLFKPLVQNNRTIDIQTVFTKNDTIILDNTPKEILSLSIDARIEQTSNSSFVRILLEDSKGRKYLVLENSQERCMDYKVLFNDYSEETIYLDHVTPAKLLICVNDAELYINKIGYNDAELNKTKISFNKRLFDNTRRKQIEIIANRINNYNQKHNKLWAAGVTRLALADYETKKRVLGFEDDNANTKGFEFYIDGIFEVDELNENESSMSSFETSPYISDFDWRNRHGKNWITPVKNQGDSGYCTAFALCGVLEARTNLFFNQKIDMDLSEQDIVYNYARNGYQIIDSIYNKGMSPYLAYGLAVSCGVIDDDSEPFIDSMVHVVPTRPAGNECIFINSHSQMSISSANVDALKNILIHNGPLSSGIMNCGFNHSMALVGYHTIQFGDTIRITDTNGFHSEKVISEYYRPDLVGQTYWVFKDSYGYDVEGRINGYFHILFGSYSCMRPLDYTVSPIISLIYSNNDIVCSDEDGDGYYFWGIGPKPAHCPAWVPDTPDGDDSDYTKGPMDNYGYLANISDLLNDTIFINQDTTWTQPRFIYSHVVVQNGATLQINSPVTFYKDVTMLLRGSGNLCLNGGVLHNADVKIIENSPSNIRILNNGNINMREETNFCVPLGGELQFDNGTIK